MFSPFNDSALDYILAGYEPIPLPLGAKFPPPKGYTGANAAEFDEEVALDEWMLGEHNVALRIPKGYVGIDIDGPNGMREFRELEKKFGKLEWDFAVSRRSDPLNNGFTVIVKYTPVQGTKLRSGLGKNIDILQAGHRYAVAPPSIHPSGETYRWLSSDGVDVPIGFISDLSDAPVLSSKWNSVVLIDREPPTLESISEDTKPEVFLESSKVSDKPLCAAMKTFTMKALVNVEGSRHDSTLTTLLKLTSMAMSGHGGYKAALRMLKVKFISMFSESETSKRDVSFEFDSMASWCLEFARPYSKRCSCGQRRNFRKF